MSTQREPFCLLTTKEAARIFGLSPSMLERLRWMGEGPPFVRPTGGRAVRYRYRDLMEWIERHRFDPDAAAVR
jgi:excisionase family DNA binding protein